MGWEEVGQGTYKVYRWKSNLKKLALLAIAGAVVYSWATKPAKKADDTTTPVTFTQSR
jgi:hypothetical protein